MNNNLNLTVEAFPQGIGYPVSGIGYDIVYMRFKALRGLDYGIQPRVRGPEIPAREVSPHPTFFMIVPEVVFDSASTTDLEIQ